MSHPGTKSGGEVEKRGKRQPGQVDGMCQSLEERGNGHYSTGTSWSSWSVRCAVMQSKGEDAQKIAFQGPTHQAKVYDLDPKSKGQPLRSKQQGDKARPVQDRGQSRPGGWIRGGDFEVKKSVQVR